MLTRERAEEILDVFSLQINALARKQAQSVNQDKPAMIFVRKLQSLIESGQAVLLRKDENDSILPNNFIGYEDETYYYIHNDSAHKAVRALCEAQGELFTINSKALPKVLAEEGLIETAHGENTRSMDHNYIPHENTGQSTYQYRVLVKDARMFKRRMKCEPGFLSELSGLFSSTRPAGSPAPNRTHERIDSAGFEKYLLLRWADLPDALPALQAARLISVRPQRLYEQVRAGVLHSVSIGGKQYCAKIEIIACAASPERLAQPHGEAYKALIEEYLRQNPTGREQRVMLSYMITRSHELSITVLR